MKRFLVVVFAAAICLSTPAVAQVRPFSQLTAQALEAQVGEPGIDLNILIGRSDDRDRDDDDRDRDHDRDDRDRDRDRDDRDRDRDRDDDSGPRSLGGFGGFGFGYFIPNLHGFEGLTEDRGLDEDFPVVSTWSGKGFGSWDGLRIGGMGGYGSYSISDYIDGDDRTAALRVGYGGFTIGYLLPLGTDRVGIHLGGAMGGGGTWISARGDDLGDDEYWAEYTGFRFFAPEVGLSILAVPWARVEFSAQYMFMDINLQGHAFVSDEGERLIDADWMGGPIYTMWFLFGHD